jgi:hypothetical protein
LGSVPIGSVFGLLMTVTKGRKASLLGRFEPHAWADLVAERQVVVRQTAAGGDPHPARRGRAEGEASELALPRRRHGARCG